MPLVKPNLPRGFRDYLPSEMIPRLKMLTTIRAVFERFGFDPLDTSAVERWEVLGVESDGSKQVYCAAKPEQLMTAAEAMDPGQRTLRFDLTVSLARCVAANWHTGNISKPFKRWQSGRVVQLCCIRAKARAQTHGCSGGGGRPPLDSCRWRVHLSSVSAPRRSASCIRCHWWSAARQTPAQSLCFLLARQQWPFGRPHTP